MCMCGGVTFSDDPMMEMYLYYILFAMMCLPTVRFKLIQSLALFEHGRLLRKVLSFEGFGAIIQ